MILEKAIDNPFEVQISFHKLLENLEAIAAADVDYRAHYAKGLLEAVAAVPELRDGIRDFSTIKFHTELIRNLLADLFPTALTNNEIKAITIPFHNITFNYSTRFQQILNNAGPDFDMEIRDFTDDSFYVMSCCMILNGYYGYNFDFSKPFFYDIPDAAGIMRHYRILYNADFIEIFPTEKSLPISAEEVDLLIDNFDNVALWKEKFPSKSWIMRGFGIMTLYDATVESAVSNLKTNLLTPKNEADKEDIRESFQSIFRSIFRFSDLRIGYSSIDPMTNQFTVSPFEKDITSFLTCDEGGSDCDYFFCHTSMPELIKESKYFVISDVAQFSKDHPESKLAAKLLQQHIHSAIFAPVVKNGTLLGIVELVSEKTKQLNTINSNKLDIVMPYLVDTIDRYYSEINNQVEALIQKEYTTIHPSVYWKFREEAHSHLNDASSLHEIVFNDVYPLFGQIDIKGSSDRRNATTKEDIIQQVSSLKSIFESINEGNKLPIFEQKIFELEQYLVTLKDAIKADSEHIIQNYIRSEIHPVLKRHQPERPETKALMERYFDTLDRSSDTVYAARKKYDATVSIINKKMADILDKSQVDAQRYYPHYYERFKTDGVEHNLYIGNSITNEPQFDFLYLYNLRLWQLQVMCEMENQYHLLQPSLPYPMEVASLILVINLPITIRFRMDEKRFDVDGSYNARYEVIKKRIDKAFIKGSTERITQEGRITIVYAQQEEEQEYKRYIAFLQHKKRLGPKVEFFEIEDLQGVSGLKGIRVEVLYDETGQKLYSYNELLKEIES
ncbi:GAF domain-containing protein [Flavobacterium magnum]|uniref:GAF domain-containing protein n=1 Tax=Flavobacterium magnum TaxID=2162713 RepID=A0A2S0REV2_9FLAO|nr:GAF domain-containing protein [Flavobacterium magnum]AWA30293.1 GAF domain-containing protein [Flavobacterium magnum]